MDLQKRLNFITGKGGVGKSTVSRLLADREAKHGKKVLIVELDSREKLNFTPKKLSPNVHGIFIPPREALKEYVLKQVKFEKIYDLIFNNKIMNFFLDAAPGIEEIAMMGKIFYLEQEKQGKKNKWDIIIVDTPATGHGLYFFKAPQVFLDISQIGPIATMAQKMHTMLSDKKRTDIHLVCLPEELPIQETIELYTELKKLKFPVGEIFLNKMLSLTQRCRSVATSSLEYVRKDHLGGRAGMVTERSEMQTCREHEARTRAGAGDAVSFGYVPKRALNEVLLQKIERTLVKFKIRSELQQEYKKTLEKSLGKSVLEIPWFLEGLPYEQS